MSNDKTHLIIIEKFGKYPNKLELAMKANGLKAILVKDIYLAAAEISCSNKGVIESIIGELSHLKEADNSFTDMCNRRDIRCLSIAKETGYNDPINCCNNINDLIKKIKESKKNMDVRVTQEEIEALLAS